MNFPVEPLSGGGLYPAKTSEVLKTSEASELSGQYRSSPVYQIANGGFIER